jgi:hypothetical protein
MRRAHTERLKIGILIGLLVVPVSTAVAYLAVAAMKGGAESLSHETTQQELQSGDNTPVVTTRKRIARSSTSRAPITPSASPSEPATIEDDPSLSEPSADTDTTVAEDESKIEGLDPKPASSPKFDTPIGYYAGIAVI